MTRQKNIPTHADKIIELVKARHSDVRVTQLTVAHPGADDDGLWYFGFPGVKKDIQIESSTYNVPFVIEHSDMATTSEAITATSIEEAVEVISEFLERLK